MFIVFDARCGKCDRTFKAEAARDAGSPVGQGEYRCVCPRCQTVATIRGETGAPTETTTGWAIRATAITPSAAL